MTWTSATLRFAPLREQEIRAHFDAWASILSGALGRPEEAPSKLKAYLQGAQANHPVTLELWGLWHESCPVACVGLERQSHQNLNSAFDAHLCSATILHWAVAPAWQRRGLGRLCWARLQEDFFEVALRCDADAVGFYRQLGFCIRPEEDAQQRPEHGGAAEGVAQHRAASGVTRYGAYWLDRRRVLSPDFRFPAPPLQPFALPNWPDESELSILRLDRIHPLLSGNKWFKLWPYLLRAQALGLRQLSSLGGAYSNHLYALAAAGQLLGFRTRAWIRGEEQRPLNPILRFCAEMGMELNYLRRSAYRDLRETSAFEALEQRCLQEQTLLIPEGAGGLLGILGTRLIQDFLPRNSPQLVALACGTAGTLGGLLLGRSALGLTQQSILGVSVLKGDFHRAQVQAQLERCAALGPLDREKLEALPFHVEEIATWARRALGREETLKDGEKTGSAGSWQIETDSHWGGYARSKAELLDFIAEFNARHDFAIEPVYTGKLLYALNQLRHQGLQAPVVALHTGGIYPSIL